MKLHVFNPEHDLALAFGGDNFTAPHAGRQLRADLGFLPALWAEDGDIVIVDDVPNALAQVRHVKGRTPEVLFMTRDDLRRAMLSGEETTASPWGWDSVVKRQLRGLCATPTDGQLAAIRQMSNRRWASRLGNTGVYCATLAEAQAKAVEWGQFVLKAPWSSSGRGIRYRGDWRWAEGVIRKQGGIMIEPYYNKVKDFGMEFEAHADGSVTYEGLSLFETVNGAYTGNLLASEAEKQKIMRRYVGDETLREVREQVVRTMSAALRNVYVGPFGVDMMVYREVRGEKGEVSYRLLPCVELNLRRTMGHVAIAATRIVNPDGTGPHQLMRIEYDGSHYHFRILNTQTNALNTNIMR